MGVHKTILTLYSGLKKKSNFHNVLIGLIVFDDKNSIHKKQCHSNMDERLLIYFVHQIMRYKEIEKIKSPKRWRD